MKKILITKSIKTTVRILFVIFLFNSNFSYSQKSAEWQEDLKFLKEKINSDYTNLFYNISAQEWNSQADKLYSEIPSMDNYEVLAGFVKLIALFQIGHTRINSGMLQGKKGDYILKSYPVQFYNFSDGVYIFRADNKYDEAVGGKILKIGNLEFNDALEAIRPLVNSENEKGFEALSMYYLTIPEYLKTQGIADNSDNVMITYLKDGKEQTTELIAEKKDVHFGNAGLSTPDGWTDARKPDEFPLWLKDPDSFRYMEYLPESKTLFVRHSAVRNDSNSTIESYFEKVFEFINNNDVEKFVLDLRMNGGGNNYLNKPVITGVIKSDKINKPGKFYCIIGRRTFSAAQNLVNELEKYTNVTFAGEPTSENVNFYGDTKTEVLPNSNIEANLSWLWWQNMDPRDSRKATLPHLAVDLSFQDYVNNQDPVLNVILADRSSENIYTELEDLTSQGKFDEAVTKAKLFLNDPVHRYYKSELENRINNYGYQLLGNKEYKKGSDILKINLELFPESANAYDSYAESLMMLGQNDEAIKYFEIAIAKDINGRTAENSKKMIDRIKNGYK